VAVRLQTQPVAVIFDLVKPVGPAGTVVHLVGRQKSNPLNMGRRWRSDARFSSRNRPLSRALFPEEEVTMAKKAKKHSARVAGGHDYEFRYEAEDDCLAAQHCGAAHELSREHTRTSVVSGDRALG